MHVTKQVTRILFPATSLDQEIGRIYSTTTNEKFVYFM